MSWTHDGLAADLMDARHLAGEIAMERLRVGPGYTTVASQLDVASMRLSWTEPRMTGYEIKVSRADFLGDIRDGKYRKYLPLCQRLFIAAPRGLVDEREIPPECGLLVRGPRTWWTARKAPQRMINMEARAVFLASLLFRHYAGSWQGAERVNVNVSDALAGPCADCGHRESEHRYRCAGAGRTCACQQFRRASPAPLTAAVPLNRRRHA